MNKNIYLLVWLMILFLVLTISGTYAWFSTRLEGNGAQVVVTTGELK